MARTGDRAEPAHVGKLGKPNEFGYVTQICEVTENTKRGARGLILPAASQIGNPHEDTLIPAYGSSATATSPHSSSPSSVTPSPPRRTSNYGSARGRPASETHPT